MKAAIIGASTESLHTIRKAKELGQTVIALDGNPEAAGLSFADEKVVIDISDEEQTIEALMDKQIDFVLTPPIGRVLTTVGAVNDALKLPGISKEAAILCTDKYLFHQCLQEGNLRDCHCYLAGKEQGELTYPAILKPRFGSGSRGIYFLKNEVDLEQALRTIGDQEDYILEEAVPGVEYGVDGVMDGTKFELVLLRKKLLTPPPARQAVGYLSIVPTQEPELVNRVQDYLNRVTSAMGLQNCLFHADLMVKEDAIFVIELSARPSGHNLHNLFTPLVSGVDMASEYIKCRIGQPYCFEPEAIRKMMIRYFDLTGEINAIPTACEVEEYLAIHNSTVKLIQWQCNINIGDRLEQVTTGHSIMGRGYFIVAGSKEEDLLRGGEEILELFGLI